MTDKKDGGSAFPIWNPDMNLGETAGPGMSLRDWFAGMAMQGLYSTQINPEPKNHDEAIKHRAEIAYKAADAMIEEHGK